jgi:hypothetical protein
VIVSDYPDQIRPLYERLNAITPVIQSTEGHKLAMDEMGNLLVKTVKTKTTADYIYVGESSMIMPRLLLDLTFKSGLVFSTLWKKITDEEKRLVSAKNKTAKKAAKPTIKKALAKNLSKKPVKKVAKSGPKKKR